MHLSDRCTVDYGKQSTAFILSRRRSLDRTHLSCLIQVSLLCVGFCSQQAATFYFLLPLVVLNRTKPDWQEINQLIWLLNIKKTTSSRKKMIQSWRKKVNVEVCVNLSPAGGVLVLVKQQNLYSSDFELNCCKLLAFLSFTLLKTTQRSGGSVIHWRRLNDDVTWSRDCWNSLIRV